MPTAKVDVEITVDKEVVKAQTWPTYDIMKMGVTCGWARRQFNIILKKLRDTDKVVVVNWTVCYGPPYHTTLKGHIGGVRGRTLSQSGIFDA